MTLILGHDKSVADWAGERLNGRSLHPGYAAWGVVDATGQLTGAIVFHNFHRHGNIEMAMVGKVMRKDILHRLARYVFGQLGCARLTARTARRNVAIQKMLRRAGFQFEGTCRRWYGPHKEDDALVFVLFSDHAKRWM